MDFKVCRQGWPFVIGCLVTGAIFLEIGYLVRPFWPTLVAALCFVAALYCAYFFRDPYRVVPKNDKWILSPADGKIMDVSKLTQDNETIWLVRIFLSVFDPHLQRVPYTGKVAAIRYTKGKFLDARDPKAHVENEQNRIEFETAAGKISVTQIAGLIARRIVCWIREGDTLTVGKQLGLIRFGSQVDITFTGAAQVRIKPGDRVMAGETVLAEIN